MQRCHRQREIAGELRKQIVQGKYPPGARIPPHVAIERQYHSSTVTVQRALNRLVAEGFLVARGQRGTYVVDKPPHLHHYGLLFPTSRNESWGQFSIALYHEAMKANADSCRLSCFFALPEPANLANYSQLVELAQSHQLAGLIFTFIPHALVGTPLIEQTDMPRVGIWTPGPFPFPAIFPDYETFLRKAVNYLQSRGRQRVALLALGSEMAMFCAQFRTALARSNITTRPYWLQCADIGSLAARQCMHLLMHGNQTERPDGLIIADDNLVEPATAGLVDAGVRVPDDMDVVAHANFPWQPSSLVPAKFLGFDTRQILRVCIQTIDMQRQGRVPPRLTIVPPVFDDEVDMGQTVSDQIGWTHGGARPETG